MKIAIVGPSGSGKSTLSRKLSEELGIPHLVSYTDRDPRHDEINGIDYNFVSKELLLSMLHKGMLTEFDSNSGNNYGIAKSDIIDSFIWVTSLHGAWKLLEFCPDMLILRLECDTSTCISRMRLRGDPSSFIRERVRYDLVRLRREQELGLKNLLIFDSSMDSEELLYHVLSVIK